jgi:hypothetical protein
VARLSRLLLLARWCAPGHRAMSADERYSVVTMQSHTLTLLPFLPATSQTIGALAVRPIPSSSQALVAAVPRRLTDYTPIQRHVLRCAASHAWATRGQVAYCPPTLHQRETALRLTAPDMRLLRRVPTPRPTFSLSWVGDWVARRLFRTAPLKLVQQWEDEFDLMRALMRMDWRDSQATEDAIEQAVKDHYPACYWD